MQNKSWDWESWREDDGAKPQARMAFAVQSDAIDENFISSTKARSPPGHLRSASKVFRPAKGAFKQGPHQSRVVPACRPNRNVFAGLVLHEDCWVASVSRFSRTYVMAHLFTIDQKCALII